MKHGLWMVVSALVVVSRPVAGQVTTRVSVDSNEAQGFGYSLWPAVSAEGRFVAFQSGAALVPGDTGHTDVFVRDRLSGTTECVSLSSAGVKGNSHSTVPAISADGRFVAFGSDATNLVPGDTNGKSDIFVRDRLTGTTERVSVDSSGAQGNANFAWYTAISADGRYVAFDSWASNLVPGDTNGSPDVFLRDRQADTTERVSVDPSGLQGCCQSIEPAISADGRYVAFESLSPFVAVDTNANRDVYVRDRQSGTTELVSFDLNGGPDDGHCFQPSISADGRCVAFLSAATDLVPGDSDGPLYDIFLRDRQSGTTELVSADSSEQQGNDNSWGCSISADGRFVAFSDASTNLVPGDANGWIDVFLRDRDAGATVRASVSSSGAEGSGPSSTPAISADGRWVAFESIAEDLVAGDTNASFDVFVRDTDATGFTGTCHPGADGVIACPCANPPSGPDRGCDNSSGTGGATLGASGFAYLSSDSLVFTTSGEKPSALSILAQWNGASASGVVFGMGVRCTSGALKRLYTKTAVLGSITAPDFGAGDPTVHARSAALGDTIAAGQSRWYLVYYRDPFVLGGCPAVATFNATQTGAVSWWP